MIIGCAAAFAVVGVALVVLRVVRRQWVEAMPVLGGLGAAEIGYGRLLHVGWLTVAGLAFTVLGLAAYVLLWQRARRRAAQA